MRKPPSRVSILTSNSPGILSHIYRGRQRVQEQQDLRRLCTRPSGHPSWTLLFNWGVSFFGIGYDSSTSWSKFLKGSWRAKPGIAGYHCMYGTNSTKYPPPQKFLKGGGGNWVDAKFAAVPFYGHPDPSLPQIAETQEGCHAVGQYNPSSD